MRNNTLQDDISRMLTSIYNGDAPEDTPTPDTEQPLNEYDVYVEPDRVTFVRKEDPGETTTPQVTVVAAEPSTEKPLLNTRESRQLAYIIVTFALFLIFFTLIAQLQIALHIPTAIITIIPKSRTLTLSGTVHLGRLLNPITISQQATAKTTGLGHQNARSARGSITFYNGQLTQQYIPAGTILTASDGAQIETTEDAVIPALDPAATPPTLGVVTIAAHAVNTGAGGNIQAYDINQPFNSVIAKNTAAFTGGQDERDFQVVTQKDISTPAATLKTTLIASMPGALQGQLRNGESLHMLPCSPTTSADHHIGEEAPTITITVSLTCSAVAYNEKTLQANVTRLLTTQAIKKLGTGYALVGDLQVSVKRAIPFPNVFLSFTSSGTWVYALTSQVQQHIKALVTGKSKSTALQLLSALSGIQRVSIAGEEDLPHDPRHIQIIVFYPA